MSKIKSLVSRSFNSPFMGSLRVILKYIILLKKLFSINKKLLGNPKQRSGGVGEPLVGTEKQRPRGVVWSNAGSGGSAPIWA